MESGNLGALMAVQFYRGFFVALFDAACQKKSQEISNCVFHTNLGITLHWTSRTIHGEIPSYLLFKPSCDHAFRDTASGDNNRWDATNGTIQVILTLVDGPCILRKIGDSSHTLVGRAPISVQRPPC